MYCKEGYCPFEDQFPKDCPGKDCWLRKMLYRGAGGIALSSPPIPSRSHRTACHKTWPARPASRKTVRRASNNARGIA